ncbi:ArsR/SmtB family transcription factor [Oceanospirillum linum]|uniref:Transcriptional regulator n=1 Tax=Oceanospirillum linum TaxID=966 RepID=A0A1T1HFM5_OCELI|nr:metalloregulator ArsR/SmtB family transcription factor [Oceanospirillum linum]OOV88517.1 transcriptional regulator [Oceanospirillum linum]SEF59121.1 transcriptional regulator, ArsR family [Oleiphilus messinensis]SMP06636.1 ArsR family transcriptional regulator [Oceanospirillum linum]
MNNEQYIDALKALAEPHRLRLFWLLIHVDQRVTVAEAMDVTGETQYNVSRNLKMLYKSGLLTQQKSGKWVYYTLAEQQQPHWIALVESVRTLPESNFAEVSSRCVLRLAMRENNECVIGPNSEEWLRRIADPAVAESDK